MTRRLILAAAAAAIGLSCAPAYAAGLFSCLATMGATCAIDAAQEAVNEEARLQMIPMKAEDRERLRAQLRGQAPQTKVEPPPAPKVERVIDVAIAQAAAAKAARPMPVSDPANCSFVPYD